MNFFLLRILIWFDQDTPVECNNVAIDFLILISVKYDRKSDVWHLKYVNPTDKSGVSFCYNYISSQSGAARHLFTRRTQVCLFDSSEWPRWAAPGWETPSPSPPPPPSRRSTHPLNHQPSLILTAGLLRDYSGTSSFSSLGFTISSQYVYRHLNTIWEDSGSPVEIYSLLFPNNANYWEVKYQRNDWQIVKELSDY